MRECDMPCKILQWAPPLTKHTVRVAIANPTADYSICGSPFEIEPQTAKPKILITVLAKRCRHCLPGVLHAHGERHRSLATATLAANDVAMHRMVHCNEQTPARQIDGGALDGAAARLFDVQKVELDRELARAAAVAALARPGVPAAPMRHAKAARPKRGIRYE